MAENWYIVLELSFDPPVEDEQKIEERLIERSKFWSAHFNDFKIGAQCRAWNQAIPQIRKDMIGPAISESSWPPKPVTLCMARWTSCLRRLGARDILPHRSG